MRTFEYRLYPTRAQRQQLMASQTESRAVYNEMLAALKAQYCADGTFPSKYDLTGRFKGHGSEQVPATTVQTLADRLSKALKRYLQRKDLGLPRSFPRFQTPNRWHSIQLRQYAVGRDVWLDKDGTHLHVPAQVGRLLKIKMHRRLDGTPMTAHLVLRADGHWYALIVCQTPPQDAFGEAHPAQSAWAARSVLVTAASRRAIAARKPNARWPRSTSKLSGSAATSTSRRPNSTQSATAASAWKT